MTSRAVPPTDGPPEDVLRAYREAESPEIWLVNEVCGFLFDDVPADEIHDRLEDFDVVMQAERDRFSGTSPEPNDTVLFVASITHPGREEYISLPDTPSAAFLLEICSNMAEAGDVINLQTCYGDGSQWLRSVSWPFSMETAIEQTCPDGPAARDEGDEEGGSGTGGDEADDVTHLFTAPLGQDTPSSTEIFDQDCADVWEDHGLTGGLDALTGAWQRVTLASWVAGAALGAAGAVLLRAWAAARRLSRS